MFQRISNSSLTNKIFQGAASSFVASSLTMVLGITRSIILVRNLLPEDIGTVTLAALLIEFVSQLKGFGIDLALIHQKNSDAAFKNTVVTIRFIIELVLLGFLLLLVPVFSLFYAQYEQLGSILIVLIGAYFISGLSQIQEAFIRKELAFRSLASIDIAASVLMTIVSITMIYMGYGIWSLIVGEFVIGFLVRFILCWLVYRVWSPRFKIDKNSFKALWNYGRPTWITVNLIFFLDRFDDFWIGTTIGGYGLGIYSKAYEYARYPRRIFANPVTKIFFPVFAQVQDDRRRLSRIFYRVMFFITRTGFFGVGLLALTIPEWVVLLLGDQWIPMITTFRIMIVYTALDPLLILSQDLLLAVGKPGQVKTARLRQALFFIPAVIISALYWDINGVAVAADLMLLIGFASLMPSLKSVVDFSFAKLFGVPTMVMLIGIGVTLFLQTFGPSQPLPQLMIKISSFSILFLGLSLMIEKRELRVGWNELTQQLMQARRKIA